MRLPVQQLFKHAIITAVMAGLLALPLAGVRTEDGLNGILLEWRLTQIVTAVGLVFVGRLLWDSVAYKRSFGVVGFFWAVAAAFIPFPNSFLQVTAILTGGVTALKALVLLWQGHRRAQGTAKSIPYFLRVARQPEKIMVVLVVLAFVFPLTTLASRYALDVAIMILTYIMLAWGLKITVGFTGLLDLGYAGFYALGAYCYALLAQNFGLGFWTCLPLAGVVASLMALVLGFPVLRLRGDYFAVVTLGFGEIMRLVLINWTSLTGGPNGIADVPRPTLFGLQFARSASEGHQTFSEYFNIAFAPGQRSVFLYYIILVLSVLIGLATARLRRLPLGRAWESFREDEIACASLGINSTGIKLVAFGLGALVAGMAGAFFAARQGFISPESFTFTESATILAIVILGGVGHPLGIVLASLFIIGLPEVFREFEHYRMVAFGLGMVMIMVWRPGGMMDKRQPAVVLGEAGLPAENTK